MPELETSKSELRLDRIIFVLIAATVFLIPFGTSSQIPCGLLAFAGVAALVISKGSILKNKGFFRYITLLLCYAVPVAISIIGSVKPQTPVKVLAMALLSLGGSIAVFHCCRSERNRKGLLTCFAVIIAFWITDTLFQALSGHDILGFEPIWGGRYGGPFTDQYMLGAYLGSFGALLIFYGLQKKWPLYLNLLVFAITGGVVLLSNTRTGWVMYTIVALVFVYQVVFKSIKHRLLVLVCCLLAGAASVTALYKLSPAFASRVEGTKPLLSGDLDSIENVLTGRLTIWHTSVNVIKDNPVNGVGARNLRKVFPEYKPDREYGYFTEELGLAINWASHPHQLVLEVGVGTGIIGLIGLLGMYLFFWKTWKEGSATQRFYSLPLATMLLAAYFPFTTHAAHYGSKYALELWMIIALFVVFMKSKWTTPEKADKESE